VITVLDVEVQLLLSFTVKVNTVVEAGFAFVEYDVALPVIDVAGVQAIETGLVIPIPSKLTSSPEIIVWFCPAYTYGFGLIVILTDFVLIQPFNDAVTV
jgi:hypothetical protein